MREYTLAEASHILDVSLWQLKYAMNTRRSIPRRLAGRTMLVTLDDARKALGDVNQAFNWRARHASA